MGDVIKIVGDGGPLRIARAATGLFHVRARSKVDALRGLGACHAYDRGMQMLLLRTMAYGRMSELLQASDKMLALDTFCRRGGFARDLSEEVAKLTPTERALGDAYCDGVNQVLAKRVPWELKILGFKAEPWRLEDAVALARFVPYVGLAQGQGELERLIVEMVQAGATRAHLEELFPGKLDGVDDERLALLRRVKLGERLVPEDVKFSPLVPKALASNNWVIAPRKTKRGRAMLANDPHLEINGLPAVWYECALHWGDRYVAGAGMAGFPAMLIGRSPDVAWGVTYSFLDGIDSWIEEVEDGRVRNPDGWAPLEVRHEVIKRKGKDDHVLELYATKRGQLDQKPAHAPGLYLATRWATGQGTGALSLRCQLQLLDANDAEAALAALGTMESAWNWVAADAKGHIGFQMSGLSPRRAGLTSGLLPCLGWDASHAWGGYLPPAELPRCFDPREGFFVTANQDFSRFAPKPVQSCAMGAWRAERIAELLAARDDWDVESVREVQLDLYSRQAEALLEAARPAIAHDPRAKHLFAWDRRCHADSWEATLFENFFRELFLEVFGKILGVPACTHLLHETAMLADFYDAFDHVLLRRTDGAWLAGRSKDELFRVAFERAAAKVPEPWGRKQAVTLRHMLFGGKLPRFLGFDVGPVAVEGSRATVRQGQVFRCGGRDSSFTSTYRMVTDLGEAAIHTVLAGGASDRRFSAWYAHDLRRWTEGRLKKSELR